MAQEITGKKVLLWFVGFFGIILIANVVLLWLAFDTWTGLDVSSPYQFSQQYQTELEDAKEQNSLNWSVVVSANLNDDGLTRIEVEARDNNGNELTGYQVISKFSRPTQSRDDIIIELKEINSGKYEGELLSEFAGQWDLITDFFKNDSRIFRSKNRIFLKEQTATGS